VLGGGDFHGIAPGIGLDGEGHVVAGTILFKIGDKFIAGVAFFVVAEVFVKLVDGVD
jgi:hypothetical protein